MKLYDVLLNNTDIKNFCAGEKCHYSRILKQMVSLMNNADIYKYAVEFQSKVTNLTIIDTAFDADFYTITKNSNKDSETIFVDSKKKENWIRLERYLGDASFTVAHIDLENKLIESIIIDENHIDTDSDITISTRYARYKDDLDLKERRKGTILSNGRIKLLNEMNNTEYEDNINSFLHNIVEEDKKIKVLK